MSLKASMASESKFRYQSRFSVKNPECKSCLCADFIGNFVNQIACVEISTTAQLSASFYCHFSCLGSSRSLGCLAAGGGLGRSCLKSDAGF